MSAEEVAARSGSSFLVSFAFLGRARRHGLTAIYAFCRVVDDAVDDAPGPDEAEEHVAFWRTELEAAFAGHPSTSVGRALQRTVQAFGVQRQPLEDLLSGVAMDITLEGFADLKALESYCRKVASAVGLACLPVFGVAGPVAERFADRLGLALQLTNILRDLRPDADQGRCYVPRQWLEECGVERDWLPGTGPGEAYAPGGAMVRLTSRLHDAAKQRFSEARQALAELPFRDRRRLLPARIMGAVYRDILDKLALRGGDLRGPRVRLSRSRKAWLALRAVLGVGA